ncbi:fimbrial protein [Franconibacter pulveris]|uniref:fimbrial protein n=1 Tax=Franconibacter pulveris TaxID=435910 RepID=UPI0008FEFF08|nr:fimbrial protein [Franconibacter pulveris]
MNAYCVIYSGMSAIKKLLLLVFLSVILIPPADAQIISPFAVNETDQQTGIMADSCENTYEVNRDSTWVLVEIAVHPKKPCTVFSYGYAPHAGNYRIRLRIKNNQGIDLVSTSTPFYLDAERPIVDQNASPDGESVSTRVHAPFELWWCYFIVDEAGVEYNIMVGNCHDGGNPLPPGPPVPDTSCTINSDNALSVSLGTLERSEISTSPDTVTAKNVPFTVNCTGGNVTVDMKLNYTPISIGNSQAVKTSANGVGVSVLYDNNPLTPADIKTVTFLQGSNTLNLSFAAVRDPVIKLEDIPTGAFTANAVLVMTQQ